MEYNLHEEIEKLSVAERISLVEEIWDSIAKENGEFELTQEQKETLDRRAREFEENPSLGRSWDEIKAEILKP
jgi:putative addiction module component (TIGR02574 family)